MFVYTFAFFFSAGIGRTGTVVVLDCLMEFVEENGAYGRMRMLLFRYFCLLLGRNKEGKGFEFVLLSFLCQYRGGGEVLYR